MGLSALLHPSIIDLLRAAKLLLPPHQLLLLPGGAIRYFQTHALAVLAQGRRLAVGCCGGAVCAREVQAEALPLEPEWEAKLIAQ